MAKIGGTPTANFKIWGLPEDADDRRTLAHMNPEIDKWRSRVNEHPDGCDTEKQVTKMTKFPRRRVSKERPAAENLKKTPENFKIPADTPKAPLKPRRVEKKLNGVPKRLEFLEGENGNAALIDPGLNHRYSTRARVAARSTQNHDENQPTSSKARPAKTKRNKNLPEFNKENDGSAANSAEQRQGTSLNKKRSGLPVNRFGSQNLAIPEDLNFTGKQLLECSGANRIEYMRWLQQRRDIGLWIECTRKGCGKWRYVEEYHDPLDVLKEWVCEMNTDARFANCAIPEAKVLRAETTYQIENAFNAGSIVWAKINGYPWWPAMVDDCPQLFRYFEIHRSSIIPYKYHVKFFNEMKIAWIQVRDVKPYAENPRSTFLKRKKIVFGTKDYTEELDAACEVADQALSLSLHQRFEKFSWAAQCFGDLLKVERDRNTKEIPPKKNKLTRTSTNYRKKRLAKKNVTRITSKTVPREKTINVRSRIVNVETDSAVNRDTCEEKNPTGSCENRKRAAPAKHEPGTPKRRLYNIGDKIYQKSELDAMSTKDFRNLICGYQHPSLTEEMRSGDGSEKHVFRCTETSATTREPILVGLTHSDCPMYLEPQSISKLSDLTFASTSYEFNKSPGTIVPFLKPEQDEMPERLTGFSAFSDGFRESSVSTHFSPAPMDLPTSAYRDFEEVSSFGQNSELLGEGKSSEVNIFAGAVESPASTRKPILIDLTDSCVDYQGYPRSAWDDLIEEIIIDN